MLISLLYHTGRSVKSELLCFILSLGGKSESLNISMMLLLSICSVVPDSLQPIDCSTPGSPVLHSFPELAQTHVHWVGDAIQPPHPPPFPSPPLLPSIFPSIRVFSNESALRVRWRKYWSFSFSFSLSNEYSGLISFRIDWFDLLAVHETLKSLL